MNSESLKSFSDQINIAVVIPSADVNDGKFSKTTYVNSNMKSFVQKNEIIQAI